MEMKINVLEALKARAELSRHVTSLATLGILVVIAIFSRSGLRLPESIVGMILLGSGFSFFVLTAVMGVFEQDRLVKLINGDDVLKIDEYFRRSFFWSSSAWVTFSVGLAAIGLVVFGEGLIAWIT